MSSKRSNEPKDKDNKGKANPKRRAPQDEDDDDDVDDDDRGRRHTKSPSKDKLRKKKADVEEEDDDEHDDEDDQGSLGKKDPKAEDDYGDDVDEKPSRKKGGSVNILIVFYSTFGHIYQMAKAAKEAAENAGATVRLRRVPETLPKEVLRKMSALEAQKQFESVKLASDADVAWADGLLWGSPTRFGNVAAQMKTFIDSLGQIWGQGKCVGKVASAFTSSNSVHGGQEMTIVAGFYPFFCHMGFVIAGLPYSFAAQSEIEEPNGCSPYGASTIVGSDGSRFPSSLEIDGVVFQTERVTKFARKLKKS